MEFFYYKNGQRIGPIDTATLKELALNGTIAPDVPIECDGKIYPARKVKGLEFPKDPAELPPVQAADQTDNTPEPEPAEAAGGNEASERVVYVLQPKGKSYSHRQRAVDLDDASRNLRTFGTIWLVFSSICAIGGICAIVAAFIISDPKYSPTLFGVGLGALAVGGESMFQAYVIYFVCAIGRFLAAKD